MLFQLRIIVRYFGRPSESMDRLNSDQGVGGIRYQPAVSVEFCTYYMCRKNQGGCRS